MAYISFFFAKAYMREIASCSYLCFLRKKKCVPYCNIPWEHFTVNEASFGSILHVLLQKKEADSSSSKWGRYVAIGVGAIVGGGVIALTGGLAAPAIAAGVGAIGLTAGGTFLLTATGTTTLYVLFGAAGASYTGLKMHRKVGALSDFNFRRISKGSGLNVVIGVSGWIEEPGKSLLSPISPFFTHASIVFQRKWITKTKHLPKTN